MLTTELLIYCFSALAAGYGIGRIVAARRYQSAQRRIFLALLGGSMTGLSVFAILSIVLASGVEQILISVIASVVGTLYALITHWQRYIRSSSSSHIIIDALDEDDEEFDREIDSTTGRQRAD